MYEARLKIRSTGKYTHMAVWVIVMLVLSSCASGPTYSFRSQYSGYDRRTRKMVPDTIFLETMNIPLSQVSEQKKEGLQKLSNNLKTEIELKPNQIRILSVNEDSLTNYELREIKHFQVQTIKGVSRKNKRRWSNDEPLLYDTNRYTGSHGLYALITYFGGFYLVLLGAFIYSGGYILLGVLSVISSFYLAKRGMRSTDFRSYRFNRVIRIILLTLTGLLFL